MQLTFTKRAGKHDDLTIAHPGREPERIACPKQGILPHDMIHYAVEHTLAHRGFLSMAANTPATAMTMRGGDSEEAVERLVETFQAEMWGGRVPAADLLATYAHACEARGHPAAPVTPDDVAAVRARLDALTARWEAVPVNGSLVLDFAPAIASRTA